MEYEYRTEDRIQGSPMTDEEIRAYTDEGWELSTGIAAAFSPINPDAIPLTRYIFRREKQGS